MITTTHHHPRTRTYPVFLMLGISAGMGLCYGIAAIGKIFGL